MRLHIHCPGDMQNGLDSPTRGEGRWTQNLARVLAEDGNDVVITAGGFPTWGETEPIDGITLVRETISRQDLEKLGPFDINMDPAWWENKPERVAAKLHLVLKWSLEDYTRKIPFPDNYALCFPLNVRSSGFFEDRCVNRGKTFFLPLPLGPVLHEPNFDKKGILWTCKDIEREEYLRVNSKMVSTKVLYPLLDKHPDMHVAWIMAQLLVQLGLDVRVRADKDIFIKTLAPYYKIREIISNCKFIMAVNLPGSVLDAAFLGVPTLEWSRGGFFNHIGNKYNVTIEEGATVERIQGVVGRYLYDEGFYTSYVKDIQNELKFNTNSSSLSYFYSIVEKYSEVFK